MAGVTLGLEELDSEKKRWGGKDIIATPVCLFASNSNAM